LPLATATFVSQKARRPDSRLRCLQDPDQFPSSVRSLNYDQPGFNNISRHAVRNEHSPLVHSSDRASVGPQVGHCQPYNIPLLPHLPKDCLILITMGSSVAPEETTVQSPSGGSTFQAFVKNAIQRIQREAWGRSTEVVEIRNACQSFFGRFALPFLW